MTAAIFISGLCSAHDRVGMLDAKCRIETPQSCAWKGMATAGYSHDGSGESTVKKPRASEC